jgi:AraC-like DNA-binding protein
MEDLAEIVQRVAYDVCDFINANRTSHNTKLLDEIHDFIRDHYMEPTFYVQTVAEHFGMSLSNLSHFYKAQTAESISEFVNMLRIDTSKRTLLDQPHLQVKEVAKAVGYNDVSSFIKRFKEVVGVTPGRFRRNGESRSSIRN